MNVKFDPHFLHSPLGTLDDYSKFSTELVLCNSSFTCQFNILCLILCVTPLTSRVRVNVSNFAEEDVAV